MQNEEYPSYPVYTKKAIFISTLFHIVILFIFFLSPYFINGNVLRQKAYIVNLVELPGDRVEKIKTGPEEAVPPLKKKEITTKKAKIIQKKPLMTLPSKKKVLAKEKVVSEKETIAKPKEAADSKTPITTAKETPVSVAAGQGAVSLDSPVFPYLYYLKILENKIYENWNPPLEEDSISGKLKSVVIFFKILKNGEIVSPHVEKSSGLSFYDQSALRAVILANPLPPLPLEFEEEFLGVHMGFKQTNKG